MVTRRWFLKAAALASASLVLPGCAPATVNAKQEEKVMGHAVSKEQSAQTLDPASIAKYVTPLVVPPAMPRTGKARRKGGKNADYYEIGVRQFQQQVLPEGLPATMVWGYGSVNHPETFHFPSFTIEAKHNQPVQVKWINELVDSSGNYLPHLLPVDPTLHWANPPGGEAMRDHTPEFMTTPGPYTGPVPIVTHVHGAHTDDFSDGFAEAWFLPAAANIDPAYATTGTLYDYFKPIAESQLGQTWEPGSSVFYYPNDQAAATLWYHDHTLGMTRTNVYAGPAGFYLIRGGPNDLRKGVLPSEAYEIPMAIQDRSFNPDGSLFYPDTREFFDGIAGPYIPESDIPPLWNPEFFGNTMLVNGKTWPAHTVEARRYRLRLLNGCNSRFLILKLAASADPEAPAALPFWQIGADGGFLDAPVRAEQLTMAPAERADVVVDFSSLAPGTEVYLLNLGPDEPFGGGEPGVDFDFADPGTTGQVMKFVVAARKGADTSSPAERIALPAPAPLPAPSLTRPLSLNEMMSMHEELDGPAMALLGLVDENGEGIPLLWDDAITENPAVGATEIWEFHNFTADAHPMHIHQVMFRVIDRQVIGGAARPPEATELGPKDTVIAYPGEITRVQATFTLAGLFVWHCHIVEHEDNEMMRPFYVGQKPPDLPVD